MTENQRSNGDGSRVAFEAVAGEERFRTIVSQATTGVVEADATGRMTLVNQRWCGMLGYSETELLGRSIADVTHPDDLEATLIAIGRLAENGPDFEIEKRYLRKDGSILWATSSVSALRGEDGEYLGLVAVVLDITKRKQAEQALREGEQRYRTLFDAMDEGYCIIEVLFDGQQQPVDYRFIEVNGSFERQTGMHDVVGRRMLEFVTAIESHWLLNYGEVALTGQPVRFSGEYERLNRFFDVYAFRAGGWPQRHVAVLFHDITERKRAEEVLRQNEARLAAELDALKLAQSHFRALFESAPGAYLVLDPQEYEIVAVSDAYLKSTMTERSAILGRKVFDVFPDDPHHPDADNVRQLRASFERVKETRIADAMGVLFYPIRRPDGQWENHWWSPVNSPVLGPEGELAYIIHRGEKVTAFIQEHQAKGTLTEGVRTLETRQQLLEADIAMRAHELQSANEQLRASQVDTQRAREYAEATLRTSPVPLLVLESDLHVITANEAFYRRFVVLPEQTEGRLVYDLGNRQWDIPELRRLLEEILPLHNTFEHFEVTHEFDTIGRRTMLLNARRMEVEEGGPERIVLVIEDISERKQAEEALRQSETRYRSLFDTIDEGFCVIEFLDGPHGALSDYVHVEANPAYERHAGISNVVGQKVREMVPEEAEGWVELYRNVLVTGELIRFERKLVATGRYLELSAFRVEPESRRQVAVLFRDVTARKHAEQALRDADRHKDEFLATLAHELRNPLAPIRSGLEVMKFAHDDPATMIEIRGMMERQTEQMVRLIDDLMDVSRITRGILRLQRQQVDLSEVLQSAVEATRPFIEQAGHDLSVALPEKPICINGDPHRLAQVISNLLHNAAKYSPQPGPIWLFARREQNEAVISIKDKGLGIPSEKLGEIFEMFSQINRSAQTGYTGLGIGLTLVKSLVEMHGGTIAVHSDGADQGSEFILRLPVLVKRADRAAEAQHKKGPHVERIKRRVLVVDDNKDAARTLSMAVKVLGNDVRVAHDGREALAVASEFRPEVVLMDLGMPKMDGYEAAHRIRQESWGKETVLVALTGWGQEEDRRRTEEAGFDYHLIKPAESAALEHIFASAASASTL